MPESGTRRWLRRAKQWSGIGGSWLLSAVAVCALLGGIGVFGWQLYHWARDGVWQSLTVLDSLSWIGIRVRVPAPNGWTVARRVVEWLPLPATGIVGGTFLLIFATGLRDRSLRAAAKAASASPRH
jgi:hypothetical protein